MSSLLIAIAVLPLVALADGRVRESARDIPVVADVDGGCRVRPDCHSKLPQ